MDTLIGALKKIELDDALPDMTGEDIYLHNYDHTLVNVVQNYATTLFISEEGEPLFDAIDQLQKEHGYCIFPGERDRFGWVTGCLQTKKGIIVFG